MKYGLAGEHLPHSFSKSIHEQIADYEYELFELKPEELEPFIKSGDFRGINVTIPYKQAVMPYLDSISETALKAGAVNTVINRGGKLYGYNTDYSGMKALALKTGISFDGAKVVILGTGGTSGTACALVSDMGAREIVKVSRSGKDGAVTYKQLEEKHGDADIVINTTPCGMYPDCDGIPCDLSVFKGLRGVIDVIYNPLETALVRRARGLGVPAAGGLYMLVAQAVYASSLFTGKEYDDGITDRVYRRIVSEKRNIVLTGMSQSGKTTVGKMLASRLDREFADTDELIEKREGLKVREIFEKYGEKYFRQAETDVIRELSVRTGLVIATGGGAAMNDGNIDMLKMNGAVFFLDRPVSRISPDADRPLADSMDKIEALVRKRYPVYRKNCDYTVINARDAADACDSVERILNGKVKILVINGPNLNMLGIREPEIYGCETYDGLCDRIRRYAGKTGTETDFYQSNHEGDIIDRIQGAYGVFDGIVINPGGYTHTSVAIADAIKAVSIPAVEVHISDVNSREEFRRISYIRPVCIATVAGHGTDGYLEAVDILAGKAEKR